MCLMCHNDILEFIERGSVTINKSQKDYYISFYPYGRRENSIFVRGKTLEEAFEALHAGVTNYAVD